MAEKYIRNCFYEDRPIFHAFLSGHAAAIEAMMKVIEERIEMHKEKRTGLIGSMAICCDIAATELETFKQLLSK